MTNKVEQRFPTIKYKRFWYPTRPLFTLGLGLFLASLGWMGILPLSWALWAAAAFALDDLPMTPIMAVMTASNNLFHGRKTLKARVIISTITIALIIGASLGFLVFAQMPALVAGVTQYIALTSCSPILISIGAILGGYTAHITHKMNPILGMGLGITLMSFVPINIPLIVEIVFISSASFAFITSIAAKQALRFYFKYQYGHSNADGYNQARSPEEQQIFIEGQANKFSVDKQAFENLTQFCQNRISTIKHTGLIWAELMNGRTSISNSYKDIYHGLMKPELTPEDIVSIKTLIVDSTVESITPPGVSNSLLLKFMLASLSVLTAMVATTRNPDDDTLASKTAMNKSMIEISGGLDESLTEPFSCR